MLLNLVGLVAVVATLFGSTAFDSFKDSTRWVKFVQGDWVKEGGAPRRPAASRLTSSTGR